MSLIRYIFILMLLGFVFSTGTVSAATEVGSAPIYADDEGKKKGEGDEEPECD